MLLMLISGLVGLCGANELALWSCRVPIEPPDQPTHSQQYVYPTLITTIITINT